MMPAFPTTVPGTVPLQILDNIDDIKNYLLTSRTDKKASDNDRKLCSFVMSICIGGNSIDWSITDSVKTVCEVLGVCKSSVYEYRKVTELVYVPPKRKRRTNALDQQPWWDHANAVLETFWEENCDEVPDADDPAQKHDFSDKLNHRYEPVPGNPDATKRVCVGMCASVIVNFIT